MGTAAAAQSLEDGRSRSGISFGAAGRISPSPGSPVRGRARTEGEQEGGICARPSPAPAITELAAAGPSASPQLVPFLGSSPFLPGILSYFFLFKIFHSLLNTVKI